MKEKVVFEPLTKLPITADRHPLQPQAAALAGVALKPLRLLSARKAKNIALTALMRKLILLANTLLKDLNFLVAV